MDANGNQRKRVGRLAKNTNNNESMSSPPRNSECNEVMEVSAVAISPTLEEAESTSNAPVAECRRSSRKKIIKFDVRDLLNKNRKTHKIQIEARIDSNAPTTSKASTGGGSESANSKTSSTVREDLLSKQKTFLEKSAIFRRYSISQEHKPPPPPLPIPPLLGKASDNNETGLSGTSTNRRLSRTQEFFSNVMIKPKQTTSLIVAQIESNTPSSSATAKRKNLNRSLELETKAEMESSPVQQQKRRGRPAKFKTPTSVESNVSSGVQEDVTKKQITPEKAKNWKEYKACLAQQTSSTNVETEAKKPQNKEQDDDQLNVTKSKQDLSTDILINFEETSQSDLSKSDDDGNFSGFQTSKDDISCDSPVLQNLYLEKEKENKTAVSENISEEIEIEDNLAKTSVESEEKELPTEPTTKNIKTKISSIKAQVAAKQKQIQEVPDVKQSSEMKSQSDMDLGNKINEAQVTAKQKQTQEILVVKQSSEMKSQESNIDLGEKVQKITPITQTKADIKNKSIDLEQTISRKKADEKNDKGFKDETIFKQSVEFSQKQESEKSKYPKEDVIQTESRNDQSNQQTTIAVKESETPDITNTKQIIRSKRRPVRKEENKDLSQDNQTKIPTPQIENRNEKTLLEPNKTIEEDKSEKPTISSKIETQPELTRKLKTPDIIKATKIIDECTPDTKLTTSDILLITSQLPESQPTTPSEETMKSFSRTSSSSESENASSYSSEPASTSSSSSSSRSYKSGDKLRVSLKRISLPKSPSTSSQTSTSEELNSSKNPDVIKKKPPMAKRSKRLQKKFVEILGNKNETDNIDDCFKRITNEELNSAEQGDNLFLEDKVIKKSLEAEICSETSKDCNKRIDSAEKVKKNVTEFAEKEISSDSTDKKVAEPLVKNPIRRDLKQKTLKSPITSEDLDSLSNDSLIATSQPDKGKILKDTSSIGKRKSLRNRKDNSSDDKDQIKAKEEEKLMEKVDEVQNLKQEETTSKEIQEITQEKLEEIIIDVEKQTTGENDQSEETEDTPRRKTRNSLTTKQQPQRKLKTQSSRNEDQKSNNEDKTKTTEETVITEKVVEEAESVEQEKDLEKSSPINESITDTTIDIIESSFRKCDQQEKYSKSTSTRSRTNKEKSTVILENLAESEVTEEIKTTKNENKSDAMKIDATEDKTARTKSPITDKLDKTTKITPSRGKTNKEECSVKEVENVPGIEITKTILKDEEISEITKAEVSQSSNDKTKSSKEITTSNAEEVDYDRLENTRKVTRGKTNIEEISTKETKNQKEPLNQKPEKPFTQEIESTNIEIKSELIKMEVSQKPSNKCNTAEENAKTLKGNVNVTVSTVSKTKEPTSIKETKIPEESASEVSKSPIPKIATTRGKTKKEEADNITPIRSRSKKAVETPEPAKLQTSSNEKSSTIQTEVENITPERSRSKKTFETSEAFKSQTGSSGETATIETKVDKITPIRSRTKKLVANPETSKSQSISSEKSATIEAEVDNITPIRSRSKKTVETVEAPKFTTTETQESAPKSPTVLKTDKHAESSKTLGIKTQEIIKTETAQSLACTKVSKPSSPKRLTRQVSSNKTDMLIEISKTSLETLEAVGALETITTHPCQSTSVTKVSLDKDISSSTKKNTREISSPKPQTAEISSTETISHITEETSEIFLEINAAAEKQETTTKVTLNKDPPSSPKRKSLRNQIDKDSIEESSTQIQESEITTDIAKTLEETSVTSTQQEQPQEEDTVKVPKRRGRKSRFKNLHTAENESETDSSNGKNTPIDEVIQQKLKEQIIIDPKGKLEDKEQTQQEIVEADKNVSETNSENVKVAEETVNLKENSKGNLSTSQIQNVSIETNTLLDILRTVQSNTEAALKANKSHTDIQKTDNENANKNLVKTHIEESAKKSSQNLLGIPQEAKLTSPTRSNTNSPLSLKGMPISPARSESASPLTLKKVTESPTRSDSSSPLTLKKVTRRYERRSRRGEDAGHKTLEETFAEIAAESSKAVLAAKEFDINVEQEQTGDENPQPDINYINTETSNENEQITENLSEIDKSPLITEELVTLKADEQVVTMESTSANVSKPLEILEKTLNDFKPTETEAKSSEKIVESQESTKLTPTRRGRKPKNRSIEVTDTKEELEEKTSTKINIESTATKEVFEETQIVTGAQEETKIDNKSNKTKKAKETTPTEISTESDSKNLQIPPTNTQIEAKETSDLTEIKAESSLKPLDDKNDIKSNKKPFKKRDTFKSEAVQEDSTNVDVIPIKEKEDEIRTPKHSSKKRDTSQTKSETKSTGKKLTKKTKNDEEDNSNLQKDDTLTKSNTSNNTTATATTPPPSKRGRKPKNQQETPQSTASSKKKNKKDLSSDNIEGNINQEKINTPESESESTLDKSLDEKLAKKKRQKKLKEAFEAALTEDVEKSKEASNAESSTNFGLTRLNKSPTPPSTLNVITNESSKITCVTPVEAEEDPDPLKDIEKFIADGVNLLKKDYKLDEDSVDDVIAPNPAKINEILEEPVKSSSTEETESQVFNTFETPADTPINTPSVTPPPKSPTSIESSTPDENSGVRRSHRIKLITKTPKALVGRGLVRDKERFSIKDDVETKSHYTLDDHLTDLAEVEAKNAKFLKEMEERLSNFQVIKENEYLCERVISREARKMICDCFLTQEEEERGELGCGEDCLNRLLMIECGPECNVKERCTNKRFQKLLCSPCRVFRTEKKGFGIMADIEILPGEFIMEYVGEVIDTDEFEKRRIIYSQDKNRHYYFMALRSDAIIDATIKGNISRFINHSCDPNAETQKWTVNGELRIGFFSRKSIMPGEEITFNYQYQRYGREAQRCYCESANCRGWIGQEPTSDEGEQIDDDEDDESEDDEEEEEADTSNLLVQDDDEDSDTSVADPEEVQKQLEMAAAQAEVELAPLQLLEEKDKEDKSSPDEEKSSLDIIKTESDEDSKSKFKKLLSKMAEKVAAKQKQTKREQKMQRKKKSKESSGDLGNKLRFLEDPDIEDEVEFLKECGLKNQSDTLRLSRLMVRAKLVQTRLNLLEILRKGDLPCRRLFLDYHGLRLLHGWMSEDAGNMQIRLALLQTLETLPIANKTVLTDSKVMQVVRNWCGNNTNLSPNEDSSSSNSNSQDVPATTTTNFEEGSELAELQKLGLKLISTWEGLPEIFRIPKKERIEQMKEHEREADRQYAANAEIQQNNLTTDRYRRDRFGRGFNTSTPNTSNRFTKPNNGNPHRTANTTPENIKNLSKAQRREMFAAKVARDEAEKRLAEERREFETKCRFFGLDPKKTRPQDIPFCVNPATGQWFSIERKPITTPPSYAHVQVPVKPKSTDPNDYQLPAVCSTLPPQWKYAITPQGKIYYYHIKHRIPQWEPPSAAQLQECEMEAREEDSESELTTTAGEDSSDDDDDVLIGMDAAQLKAYIDRKVEMRRQKRYQRLVDERSISPRREEDRIYNQIEVRKYKENKEKIRKRKEEIRRRRAEALRQTSLNMCTLGSITETNTSGNKLPTESDEELGVLPIQDYLLSSDEEVDLKAEVNSPLMDKIVEGDKIVDELDALTTKRQLKRPLPPHRDLSEASTSSASSSGLSATIARQEYKKRKLEKKEKRKPKEQQDAKYRKNKEKFRCEIAGIIVHHLKPYRKDSCTVGRIQSNEDFNHLARKLTHFVMIKELKYCESVGQTLVVTESVKSKSREFIKKYMAKYGEVYVKPTNDPDFKDIPFTL